MFGQKVLRLSWCIASIWSEFAICVYTFGNHHHLANNPQWSIRTEGRAEQKREPFRDSPPSMGSRHAPISSELESIPFFIYFMISLQRPTVIHEPRGFLLHQRLLMLLFCLSLIRNSGLRLC